MNVWKSPRSYCIGIVGRKFATKEEENNSVDCVNLMADTKL